MTKGEQEFLDQYTRKLMVPLCRSQMKYGDPFVGVAPIVCDRTKDKVFIDYAIKKKWLSVDGSKVLSGGWGTAARFLKR